MVAQIFIVCFGSIFEQTSVAFDGIRVKEALLRTIFFVHYIRCTTSSPHPTSCLHCTVLHKTRVYCTALYCTALYCTVRRCTDCCCAISTQSQLEKEI